MKRARVKSYWLLLKYLFNTEGIGRWVYLMMVVGGFALMVIKWFTDGEINLLQALLWVVSMVVMMAGVSMYMFVPQLFKKKTLSHLSNFRQLVLFILFMYVALHSVVSFLTHASNQDWQFSFLHLVNVWCLLSVIVGIYLFLMSKFPSAEMVFWLLPGSLAIMGRFVPQLPMVALVAVGSLIWLVFGYWWLTGRNIVLSNSENIFQKLDFGTRDTSRDKTTKPSMLWNYVVINSHSVFGHVKFLLLFFVVIIIVTGILIKVAQSEDQRDIPVILFTATFTAAAFLTLMTQADMCGNIRRLWLLVDSREKILKGVENHWIKLTTLQLSLWLPLCCLTILAFDFRFFTPLLMVVMLTSLLATYTFSFYLNLWGFFTFPDKYQNNPLVKIWAFPFTFLIGVTFGNFIKFQLISAVLSSQILLVFLALILRHQLYKKINHADLVKIG